MKKKTRRDHGKPGPGPPAGRAAAVDVPPHPDRRPATPGRAILWFRDKNPILRFAAVFGALMVVFYVVFYIPPRSDGVSTRIFNWYLSRYADAAGAVLGWTGDDVTVQGQAIHSPRFSVNVVRGCDAMEATALVVAAILATPVPLRRKWPGIVGGVAVLAILNLVRIVSLFHIGTRWPTRFEAIHISVWQPAFIVLAVLLWLTWAWWATQPAARRPHAAV